MPATAYSQSLKLTIIGAGQVATHLSLAFARAGHQIQAVYSRHLAHAAQLAAQLPNTMATNKLNFREQPPSDLYLISVTDAALTSVIAQAQFRDSSRVVHTSGSMPLSVLTQPQNNLQTGVFYPVQTFSRHQPVDLTQTPIALEADAPALADLLQRLASSISGKVLFMNGPERKKLHLAAVFACNFTNHLLGISHEIMVKNNLDPGLLEPLIKTTFTKSLGADPFTVQTGPAVRGDENILQEQLQMLNDASPYQDIYRLITQSIQARHNPQAHN